MVGRLTLLWIVSLSSILPGVASQDEIHPARDLIPVAAPLFSGSAGRQSSIAVPSVVRVICPQGMMGGSGFFHRSGVVITAAHVVADCEVQSLRLIMASGEVISIVSREIDATRDLAILIPAGRPSVQTLPLSPSSEFAYGVQVATWGFPAGYNGTIPLLTVGYLAGVDRSVTEAGLSPQRWVVNAAFNGGNSGGPVVNTEDGTLIGVVSSKLAPIPPPIEGALEALSRQRSGVVYTWTYPDGRTEMVSEGQVIAEVLTYLRSQTQLVLGHAVTVDDLRAFLRENGISP